jgi:hypothetical protein
MGRYSRPLFVALVLMLVSRGYAATWLYWTDTALHSIQRAPADGSGPVERVVGSANGVNEPRGIAVDLHGGKMYWADTTAQCIRSGRTDGVGAAQLLYSAATSALVSNPWGIALGVVPCGSFVAPDLNHDCYVDRDDMAMFVGCFSGPKMPMIDGCGGCDFDDDDDVDQADFSRLQRCYRGSRPVVDVGCDD